MIIQVDLKRNPEVADLIADMDMGSGVCFKTTLKSRSDALAEFTLSKAEECENEPADASDGDGSDAESSAEDAGESGSTNTPGGSVMQDKLAAATTAQL